MKKGFKLSNLVSVVIVVALMLAIVVMLFITMTSNEDYSTDALKRTSDQSIYNFLILGRDSAAGLCDMIMLGSINTDRGDVNFLQIPRDTYFNCTDGNYKKINGAYNSLGSAKAFSEELERALGIKIDYYLSFNLDTVAQIVDTVKGIKVKVPFDMDYEDPSQNLSIHLKKGEQELDGKEAIQFLRYRSGYVTGDLGRIDAQKLFLNSFAKRIIEIGNPFALYNVFRLICNKGETNLREQDLISIGLKCAKTHGGGVYYMTAPGEAVQSDISGAWYYILSASSNSKILSERFGMSEIFDKDDKFVDKNVKTFFDIYNKSCEVRIYTADEIDNNEININ